MPYSIPESAIAEGSRWWDVRAARQRLRGARLVRRSGPLGLVLCAPVILLGLLAPWLAPSDPAVIVGPALLPPSGAHWLGTDALGRDLLSGIIFGARTSLILGVVVGAIAFVIGTAVGIVASYEGGWTDDLLMRGTEFFQVIPRFFLAIMTIALFGPGLDRVIVVLGLTSWTTIARVTRAESLALMERDFIRAARATGATDMRVITRALLPNVLPAAVVVLGLVVGQVLLIEASLGFIGLGDPNLVSWGGQAGQANTLLRVAWWLPLFPGAAIAITVLGCNLLADALMASPRDR